MQPPKLTRVRWRAMITIKNHKRFQVRSFLANELRDQICSDFNIRNNYNAGMSLFSLEQAGWVKRIDVQAPTSGPFRLPSNIRAWELTDKGLEVLDYLPKTQPARFA